MTNEYIAKEYKSVGDLSSHLIMLVMEKIKVIVRRVSWVKPVSEGYRNPL